MPPVPDDAFRELLADCSPSAFAAFVADLWRVRGHDVRRDGDRLRVDDGELRPVVALDPDSFPDDPVVVTATEPPASASTDESVVGPADLHRMLLYGVPRERAAELFEAHFDRPLDDDWSDLAPDASAPAPDDTETAAGVTGSPPEDDREAAPDDIGVVDSDDGEATESDPGDGTDPEAPDEPPTRSGGGWRGRRLAMAATWLPRSRGDVRALVGDRQVQVAVVAALAVLAAAGWGLFLYHPAPETPAVSTLPDENAPPPVDGSYRAVAEVELTGNGTRRAFTMTRTYVPGDPDVAVRTWSVNGAIEGGRAGQMQQVAYQRGDVAYVRQSWTNASAYRRAAERRDAVKSDDAARVIYRVDRRATGVEAEPFRAVPVWNLRHIRFERQRTVTRDGRRVVRYVPTTGWTAMSGPGDETLTFRIRAASGEVLVDDDTGAIVSIDVEATFVRAGTWWAALTRPSQDLGVRYRVEPDVDRPEAPPWVAGLEVESTDENASVG